jgi:hypothetical protein
MQRSFIASSVLAIRHESQFCRGVPPCVDYQDMLYRSLSAHPLHFVSLAARGFRYRCSLNLTLKAFANFSPRLRFGNPGKSARGNPMRSQLLQSCDKTKHASYPQGFKANPGLEFANTFGVKFKLQQYSVSDCYPINCKGCHDNEHLRGRPLCIKKDL